MIKRILAHLRRQPEQRRDRLLEAIDVLADLRDTAKKNSKRSSTYSAAITEIKHHMLRAGL